MMNFDIISKTYKNCQNIKNINIINNEKIIIKETGIYNIKITTENIKLRIDVKSKLNVIINLELEVNKVKIDLNIKANSNVGYYIFNKGNNVTMDLKISENSFIEVYNLILSDNSNSLFNADLIAPNTAIYYNLRLYGKNNDNHSHKTTINHLVESTFSNIDKRAVLNNQSLCKFDVKSYIKKGSSKSQAYQKSRIINLSDNTKSYINPILLIDDYDVMGSHAATTSKVNEEQLYYLQSRGLKEKDALKLITLGFLLEGTTSLLIDKIENLIERKMNNE